MLRCEGFAEDLVEFFADYLKGRFTRYLFNGKLMDATPTPLGVGQGSAFSPMGSGLYIAPILHKHFPVDRKMPGNGTLKFYVDDGAFMVAAPLKSTIRRNITQVELNVEYLQVMFHSLNGDLLRVGLGVEADKVEVMHFWKKRKPWKPDKPTGPDVVIEIDRKINHIVPKVSMRYLGFYLDPKLSFKSHIRFYAAKAASTVSTLTMLGNSLRGFTPMQKRQLYIAHVLPLMCYGAHLWWKPGWKGIGWIAKEMQGAQSRAVRWITGAFRTTPIGAMELIAGVVPVKVNITRYMEKHALHIKTLHPGVNES